MEGAKVQCTQCGRIFKVNVEISYEDIYVKEICPGCRKETTCLNIEDDVYRYYDPHIDKRFFEYN